jgi:tetratricopeptide (TPR) repeat protein
VPDLPGLLDELVLLNSEGRYEMAVALGEPLLKTPESGPEAARIRYEVAMAYVQSGQTARGSDLLAEVRAYFESIGDAPMVAECMASEAGVACTRQQSEALSLALQALAACRILDPVPASLEVRVLNYLASAHVTAGEFQEAAQAYEEAIERAGPLFDMRRRARLFNDAAIAYGEMGRIDEATARATKAIALFEVLRDSVSLARVHNNLGMIFVASGELGSARVHLERSLQLCDEANVEHGRSYVLLSLCELSLAEGDQQQAGQFAQDALAWAERMGESANVAEAHLWLGRVAEELAQPQVADLEFAQATERFGRLGMRQRLLHCHRAYAEILEARGDLRRAYAHLKTSQSLGKRL